MSWDDGGLPRNPQKAAVEQFMCVRWWQLSIDEPISKYYLNQDAIVNSLPELTTNGNFTFSPFKGETVGGCAVDTIFRYVGHGHVNKKSRGRGTLCDLQAETRIVA